MRRATGTLTISTGRWLPTRNWATFSGLPIVADKPMSWKSLPVSHLSLSRARDSWLPRLLSASSWTSSTMTKRTCCRCWRKMKPVRIACSVSGVVMSMSGGLLVCLARSLVSVSPWRTANLTSRLLHHHSRRSSMSRFKALSGVMYRTLIPGGLSGILRSMFKTGSIAASVFPVAVGEIKRTFFPSRILGIVFS